MYRLNLFTLLFILGTTVFVLGLPSIVYAQGVKPTSIQVPQSVLGGEKVRAAVSLDKAAPTGGAEITLSSSNSSVASVPLTVTIPSGKRAKKFNISTTQVAAPVSVTISASSGEVTKSTTITVEPPPPALPEAQFQLSIISKSKTVLGGETVRAAVSLDKAAPTRGFEINLSSSNSSVASVPLTITIPSGRKSKKFDISTTQVTAPVSVTFSASSGEVTKSVTITVGPPPAALPEAQLTSIQVPRSVQGGEKVRATVSLDGAAPTGGAEITLSSSNSSVASVPLTVTIPSGGKEERFDIRTTQVTAPVSVTISASYGEVTRGGGGTSLSTAMRVDAPLVPPVLTGFTLSPNEVESGYTVTGTVTLDKPAPTGGTVVTLTHFPATGPEVNVPPEVIVPRGQPSESFDIRTAIRLSSRSFNIFTHYEGVELSQQLTIMPSTLQVESLSASATELESGESVTLTVNLNKPVPPTGARVFPYLLPTCSGQPNSRCCINTGDGNGVFYHPTSYTVNENQNSFTFQGTHHNMGSEDCWQDVGARVQYVAETSQPPKVHFKILGTVAPVGLSIFCFEQTFGCPTNTTLRHGGSPATVSVQLNRQATSNTTIQLSSDNSTLLSMPSSITIQANTQGNTFSIQAVSTPSAPTSVTVSASYGGQTKTISVTIEP